MEGYEITSSKLRFISLKSGRKQVEHVVTMSLCLCSLFTSPSQLSVTWHMSYLPLHYIKEVCLVVLCVVWIPSNFMYSKCLRSGISVYCIPCQPFSERICQTFFLSSLQVAYRALTPSCPLTHYNISSAHLPRSESGILLKKSQASHSQLTQSCWATTLLQRNSLQTTHKKIRCFFFFLNNSTGISPAVFKGFLLCTCKKTLKHLAQNHFV